MRDRSPRETPAGITPATAERSPRLARFALDQQNFELILCRRNAPRTTAELVRFDLNGATVAVVEERASASEPAAADDVFARLTGRELQVAALVAEGNATKNIAYKLRISEWTVGTYLRRIFAKLNVENRAAMVYLCAPLLKDAGKSIAVETSPPSTHYRAREKVDAAAAPRKSRNEDLVKV